MQQQIREADPSDKSRNQIAIHPHETTWQGNAGADHLLKASSCAANPSSRQVLAARGTAVRKVSGELQAFIMQVSCSS
eukprot:1157902-Pelagomonas_calceolata.AAC.2